jgi:PKD repeat protein
MVKNDYITSYNPYFGCSNVTADFTASPTTGDAPLTVNFTNSSTALTPPLTYQWDFNNDGVVDSTEDNPSYTYNSAGSYTVKLTATDPYGRSGSVVKTDYIASCGLIRVQGPPVIYYPTLLDAYNAAEDGETIQGRDHTFSESLYFNSDKSILLEGGYDCSYTTITGRTTISGNVTIGNGTVTIQSGTLEVQ